MTRACAHPARLLAVVVVVMTVLAACGGGSGPSVEAGARPRARVDQYVGFRYVNEVGQPVGIDSIGGALLPGIPYGWGFAEVTAPEGRMLWLQRTIADQKFDCGDNVACRLQPGVGAWEVTDVLLIPSVTGGPGGDVIVYGQPCALDGVPDAETVALYAYAETTQLSAARRVWVADRVKGEFRRVRGADAVCDNPYLPID